MGETNSVLHLAIPDGSDGRRHGGTKETLSQTCGRELPNILADTTVLHITIDNIRDTCALYFLCPTTVVLFLATRCRTCYK